MKRALILLVVLASSYANAANHGPVFGLATPTNSQGEWSFDQGVFDRTTSLGSQASFENSSDTDSLRISLCRSLFPASLETPYFRRLVSSRVMTSIPLWLGVSNTQQRRSGLGSRARHSLVWQFPVHNPHSVASSRRVSPASWLEG